ncbi:hypothetical protein TNCV_402391 [Trichonephila clavipes]|nr:hypothetical protein TNCV_402391 [Trichonephila clavipes]
MEVTRVEQRSYIKKAARRGINAMEYHSELVEDLGNNALRYLTVVRWLVLKFCLGGGDCICTIRSIPMHFLSASVGSRNCSGRPLYLRVTSGSWVEMGVFHGVKGCRTTTKDKTS